MVGVEHTEGVVVPALVRVLVLILDVRIAPAVGLVPVAALGLGPVLSLSNIS